MGYATQELADRAGERGFLTTRGTPVPSGQLVKLSPLGSTFPDYPIGWPLQPVEDTFDLPPFDVKLTQPVENTTPEYKAEFGPDGSARLYIYTPRRLIANFETFADAETAAKALNEAKGY